MIKDQVASSYAELNAFVNNNKASIGRYLVKNDETNLGNPIEYYYDGTKLIVTGGTTKGSGGAGLPTILGEVATETLIATTYTTPKANDGVIVTADSTQSNRRTWYIYDGAAWGYKGIYKGDNTQEENSLANTRGAIIAASTDYTLPNNLQYTVDTDQLTIMINNQVSIKDIDWKEIGVSGVQSKKIQFLYAIPVTANLVFRKDVSSTDLLYMQRNIDMDLIRKQTCAMMGVEYGGEIQYTTLREADKVYWCNVNQKWYIPKFTSLLPVMTSNSQGGFVLSSKTKWDTNCDVWKMFDGDALTYYCNASRTTQITVADNEWFIIEKATPFHMNSILLKGKRDNIENGTIIPIPKQVKIEGYDGASWIQLAYFSDIAMDATLIDGDLVGFYNNNSYYKYRFTIESTKYGSLWSTVSTTRYIHMSGMECYSGKGSWTIADTDWTLFDPEAVKRFDIQISDMTTIIPPIQICGVKSRNLVHIEIDWASSFSTEYTPATQLNIPIFPKCKDNSVDIELNGGNGGFMKIYADGTCWVAPSIDTPTKRTWFRVSYPYKKDVRTYV